MSYHVGPMNLPEQPSSNQVRKTQENKGAKVIKGSKTYKHGTRYRDSRASISPSVFGATAFSKVTQLFCRLPLAALSCMTIDHQSRRPVVDLRYNSHLCFFLKDESITNALLWVLGQMSSSWVPIIVKTLACFKAEPYKNPGLPRWSTYKY